MSRTEDEVRDSAKIILGFNDEELLCPHISLVYKDITPRSVY